MNTEVKNEQPPNTSTADPREHGASRAHAICPPARTAPPTKADKLAYSSLTKTYLAYSTDSLNLSINQFAR